MVSFRRLPCSILYCRYCSLLLLWLLLLSIITVTVTTPVVYGGHQQHTTTAAVAAQTELPQLSSSDAPEDPAFTDEYLSQNDAIAIGETLWAKQCRHCHGSSAYPGKAPKLKPVRYNPEFVFDRITDGFRKMPAWKSVFSLDERKSLVAYILSDEFSP